jgi:hypothetical protein
MTGGRLKELAAIILIGEGVIWALRPRPHVRLWQFGPKGCRKFIGELAKRPNLNRALGATEAGLGLWWALRPASG